MDKSDKHKLTKPESVVSNSCSKSPSRSKQTESVEVLEKTNIKGSMEYEKCELIEEQQQPASDWELSAEEERDISEHCTDDRPVERISYTKVVVHCVIEFIMLLFFLIGRIDGIENL